MPQLTREAMSPLVRFLLALFTIGTFAGLGFVAGTVATIVSAIPALAGGGHAVGGEHTNYAIAGLSLGTGAGLVTTIWLWHQAKAGKRPPGRNRRP